MKNKRRLSFRRGGWKGVSNPLLSLPFNGPIPAGRKYAGRFFRETRRFSLRSCYLVSFFSIPREKLKGVEGRRIRGSPIIIPLNAFLLAHPSQMGAAVNIRKTTVLGGDFFDVLHRVERIRAFRGLLTLEFLRLLSQRTRQKSIGCDRMMGL